MQTSKSSNVISTTAGAAAGAGTSAAAAAAAAGGASASGSGSGSTLVDLIRSPLRDDEFVAVDSDLYLYKTLYGKSSSSSSSSRVVALFPSPGERLIKLADETYMQLVASYGENSMPKLAAWQPSRANPHMLAVYFLNHKLQLLNLKTNDDQFGKTRDTMQSFQVVKEFSFKQVRNVSNLAWNPFQEQILAAGFSERLRTEQAILIWDVNGMRSPTYRIEVNTESIIYSFSNEPLHHQQQLSTPTTPPIFTTQISQISQQYELINAPGTLPVAYYRSSSSGSAANMFGGANSSSNANATAAAAAAVPSAAVSVGGKRCEIIKPVYETSASESCYSLSWNPHVETSLLAGLIGKLKIFDTRAKSKGGSSSSSVSTKCVYGFSIDAAPNGSPFHAASYNENIVALWDTRMFNKPLQQMDEKEHIVKMQWCPTNAGKICVLTKNSKALDIYSIMDDNNVSKSSTDTSGDASGGARSGRQSSEPGSLQLVVDRKPTVKSPTPSVDSVLPVASEAAASAAKAVTSTLGGSGDQQKLREQQQLTHFCWIDSNKVLVATNSSCRNISSVSLFDSFALCWSLNDEFLWSLNSIKVNTLERLPTYRGSSSTSTSELLHSPTRHGKAASITSSGGEYNFISEFKARTRFDYGLKYEVITISNGNATSISSDAPPMHSQHTLYQPPTPTATLGSSAIPLALALHSYLGLGTLIRADFLANSRVFGEHHAKPMTTTDVFASVRYLWQWFDTTNRLFEISIPLNPPNRVMKFPSNSRNLLVERYPTRYCGLRTLLYDCRQQLQQAQQPLTPQALQGHDDRFRTIAYYLCGWDFKDGAISPQFLANLEINNQFERACCLALLTQNFEQALEILEKASRTDSRYGCLWIALKYFYDEQVEQQQLQQQQQQQNKESAQANNGNGMGIHLNRMVSTDSSSVVYSKPTSLLSSSLQQQQQYQHMFGTSQHQQQQQQNAERLNRSVASATTGSTTPLTTPTTPTPSSTFATTKSSLTLFGNKQQQQAINSSSSTINDTLLRECNKLIDYFKDPYLKAMFSYLINKEDAVMKILRDRSIRFQDRIALSVYFMYPANTGGGGGGNKQNHAYHNTAQYQQQLLDYFDSLIEDECLAHADLHCVLLTGLGPRCIDIFQAFIDRTFDIQTIALAIIHSPYPEVLKSAQAKYWIVAYRELLNKFKFWEQRAKFDVFRMKLEKAQNLGFGFGGQSLAASNPAAPVRSATTNIIVSPYPGERLHNHAILKRMNARYYMRCNECFRDIASDMSSASSSSFSANATTTTTIGTTFGASASSASLNTVTSFTNMNSASVGIAIGGGGGGGSNHNNNNNNNGGKVPVGEMSVNACLGCGKFFPQCVVCLRLMRVNVQSSSLAANGSASTLTVSNIGGGGGGGGGNNSINSSSGLGGGGGGGGAYLSVQPPSHHHMLLSPKLKMGGGSGLVASVASVEYSTPGVGGGNFSFKSPASGTSNSNNHSSQQQQNDGDLSLAVGVNVSKTGSANSPASWDPNNNNNNNSTQNKALSNENMAFMNATKYGMWFSQCNKCKHGGHISHLAEWFRLHNKCAFLHCTCQCAIIDKALLS